MSEIPDSRVITLIYDDIRKEIELPMKYSIDRIAQFVKEKAIFDKDLA